VRSLGRRPGQKEDRYEHLFGGDTAPATAATPATPAVSAAPAASATPAAPAPRHEYVPTVNPAPAAAAPAVDGDLSARVAALEDEVAALRADLDALRQVGSASPTR
jgi:uncharacterized protein YceH (UPF0502 family)